MGGYGLERSVGIGIVLSGISVSGNGFTSCAIASVLFLVGISFTPSISDSGAVSRAH